MAVQVVPQMGGLAEALGQGLGGGFSQSLQGGLPQLLEYKINELVRPAQEAQNLAFARALGLESGLVPQNGQQMTPESLQQSLMQGLVGKPDATLQEKMSQFTAPGSQQQVDYSQFSPQQQMQLLRQRQETQQRQAQQDLAERKLTQQRQLQEQKLSAAEQREANKETRPYFDKVLKEAKSAQENKKRLDRMEILAKEGNLGTPLANSLVKTISHGIFGLGLDLGSLRTADAQEFDKLSADFIKGAKDIFGSRVTDNDLKAFMATVPNLSQSRSGMLRLINSLRNANEAAEIRKKAARDIIKENNGKRPPNFELLVEDRVDPELDRLAQDFLSAPRIPDVDQPNPSLLKTLSTGLFTY